LENKNRPTSEESVPHEARSEGIPNRHAHGTVETNNKKNVSLTSAKDQIEAWSEAQPRNHPAQLVARQYKEAAKNLTLDELRAGIANDLIQAWKEKYRSNTVGCFRGVLRRLLVRLVEKGASEDIVRMLQHVTPFQPRQVVISRDEIMRLLAGASPWLAFVITACYTLALRSGEATRLGPSHFNQEKQRIEGLIVKGNKWHSVPVTDTAFQQAMSAISTDRNDTRSFAEILRGKPLTPRTAQHMWLFLKRKTKVRASLRMHDLRRTRATECYQATFDVMIVKKMLGHTSLTTTAGYIAHATDDALREGTKTLWSPARQQLKQHGVKHVTEVTSRTQ